MIRHIVFHREWNDISGFCDWLATKSPVYLVVQHDADDIVKTTHCHIACEVSVSDQAIRDAYNVRNLGGRGQVTIMSKTEKTRQMYDINKLITYIIKGNVENVKRTTLGVIEVSEHAAQWINMTASDAKPDKGKDKNDHFSLIQEILNETKQIPGMWTEVLSRDEFGHVIREEGLTDEGRLKMFDYMVKKLNKNRIRTSRNELERFYVTIVRHDYHSTKDLRTSILQNVFRNN